MACSLLALVAASVAAGGVTQAASFGQMPAESLIAGGGPRAMSARSVQQSPPSPRGQMRAVDPSHVFDVTEFGAVGDNSTDNTNAFAKALQKAFESNGGMVSVPPGLYVLEGQLTIPPGVSLTGSYRVVPSHDLRGNQPITDGTVLIPTGGRGSIGCEPDPESNEPDLDCTEAFITITENALVQGLVVW